MENYNNEKLSNGKLFVYWFLKNAWIILICVSVLLFVLPEFLGHNDFWTEMFHKIAIAILSTAVFTFLIKSYRYIGVFRREIEDIIYADKFKSFLNRELQNSFKQREFSDVLKLEIGNIMSGTDFLKYRSDLPSIWSATSKLIYREKFPNISESIETIILDSYFPTHHEYYYKDMLIDINIKSISDDMVIKYTETMRYNVIMEKDQTESVLIQYGSVDEENGYSVKNELIFFKIDGNEITLEESAETVNLENKFKYEIPLTGSSTYEIHCEYDREFSLRTENYALTRMRHLTHGMEVDIHYPEDVTVSFFNIGLTNKFEEHHKTLKGRISRIHKNGVILPQQGFGLCYQKLAFNKKKD